MASIDALRTVQFAVQVDEGENQDHPADERDEYTAALVRGVPEPRVSSRGQELLEAVRDEERPERRTGRVLPDEDGDGRTCYAPQSVGSR
ncbi:hypothetical protein C490_08426 [Natronobacterium gregoryi SP2]|uniref:Uncharacterized protein n=1 Tax=Natronobacterium gregoryi (strain ATCC 43098 / DSM 3393 / CCM 3738 / CIP 104747 / IAM 13177 / JCM 8860 / NBRC 102187 / NCIMB 2189 / SP2) TaxID=797304 RepID=L9Y5L9_NATGS|nr:hypothetical protein C490_08426 [Natronobacterium gregoryi SP2]